MESARSLYVDVFDVEQRLTSLGLNQSVLLDAVRAGFLARSQCTELDPPMYPGQTMWAVTLRRLRQGTALLGWTPSNDRQYSVALSPDEATAITVATGDINTGRPGSDPSTMSPKGPRTVEAVAANQLCLDLRLPGVNDPSPAPADNPKLRETWLLLIHLDRGEVRAELSLPSSLDADDRVTGWRERILLPAIDFDPDQIELPVDDSPDINIDVRRRA